MSISFQKTDAKAAFELPAKGPYYAKITSAEVKNPTDPTKYPYLNITYEIYDFKKEKKGIIFDMLSTSDHPFCQQRLGRFMTALGLAGKEFATYSDICKVIKDRKLGFFITPDTSDYVKQNPDKARMIVDSRDEGIYYSVPEMGPFMPEIPQINRPTATTPASAPAAAPPPAAPASNESALPFDVDNEDF